VLPAAGYNASSGFSPSQIRTAYGINAINLGGVMGTGAGQTIAIVDAYNDPTIAKDLAAFDTAFGLPAPPSFKVLNQNGKTTSLPSTDPTGAWELEEALDVEWAHAVAPAANIVLVEANSNGISDLFTAIDTASHISGVSVVSMSWGFAGGFSTETDWDSDFNVSGITFVAATGDNGSSAGYPADSPNVVAVGGTSLYLSNGSKYGSEIAWSDSSGGLSQFESRPSYQDRVSSIVGSKRGTPDVAFDASLSTGVSIYDTSAVATYGSAWIPVGGTSVGSPAWAGIIAIADQGRARAGLRPLSSAQTLAGLYSLPSADFHAVTSGSNAHYSAKPGYDLVTGLGTPVANLLVPGLMALSSGNTSGSKSGTKPAGSSAASAAALVDGPTVWAAIAVASTDHSAGNAIEHESLAIDSNSGESTSTTWFPPAVPNTEGGVASSVGLQDDANTAILYGFRGRQTLLTDEGSIDSEL